MWRSTIVAVAAGLCVVLALVLQLSALSGPAELLIKPKMPYFHGMRKLEARKAHGGLVRGMARIHPTQKHAAVAGGQGNTVGWSHYSAAPRAEYGAELPTNGNAWGQLGQAHSRHPFTAFGQAERRFEEPVNDKFGTDSSFLNKGDSEGVTMKAPAHSSMLAHSKKPYFHGMRKLQRMKKQQLMLKPVVHKMKPHTYKLVNYQEKKPYFHKMHRAHQKQAAPPKAAPAHAHTPQKAGMGFKF